MHGKKGGLLSYVSVCRWTRAASENHPTNCLKTLISLTDALIIHSWKTKGSSGVFSENWIWFFFKYYSSSTIQNTWRLQIEGWLSSSDQLVPLSLPFQGVLFLLELLSYLLMVLYWNKKASLRDISSKLWSARHRLSISPRNTSVTEKPAMLMIGWELL